MASDTYLKRNWKLILNIVTILALVVLAIAVRKQLVQTIDNLGRVHAWALLLIIPIEVLNYHAQTRMFQGLFNIVEERLTYKYVFKLALELNFVNHVFPSGGVSGISYFGLRLRSGGISTGKSTVVQLMKFVMIFASFEVLLIFGMLILAAVGRVNNLVILLGGSLTTLMVAGTAAGVYIIGDRRRVQVFFSNATRFINRVIHLVRPKHPETISLERVRPVFDELHENYSLFKSKLKDLRGPFWWAMVANITEILAVYVVYIAFGHWVNLGAMILAYAVANFAGFVSVLPGGVGVYEALMTGVLVIGGVPAAVSIPATIMYRVVNTVIQVPPGYVLYHRYLRRKNGEVEVGDV